MTSRPSTAAPILAVLLLPLTVYLGGYFDLSTTYAPPPGAVYRRFRTEWQTRIYRPVGHLEAWVRGKEVFVVTEMHEESHPV